MPKKLRRSLALSVLSLVLLMLSDLCFVWTDGRRLSLICAGCLSGIAGVVIGFSADTLRHQLVSLIFPLIAAILCLLASGPLSGISFRLYANAHEEALQRVAEALHRSEVEYVTSHVCNPDPSDCAVVRRAMEKAGVSISTRLEEGGAVLELYGVLDARGGVLHCSSPDGLDGCGGEIPGKYIWHMSGPWFGYHEL